MNFPWGSLLAGLLSAQTGLPAGLAAVVRPGARIEVRLNGGALHEAGTTRVRQLLLAAGFVIGRPAVLGAAELRRLPTTWAKRLAFGRDPRGMVLRGKMADPLH